MHNVFEAVIQSIANQEDVVLATIIDNVGSSPRSSGTKMLIRKDHSIVGTIGGGKLEANTIKAAEDAFKTKSNKIYHFLLTGTDAAASEMICGGFGDVLLCFISGSDLVTSEVLKAAVDSILSKKKGWLITSYTKEGSDALTSGFCFISENGKKIGNIPINEEKLSKLIQSTESISIHSDILESENLLIEKLQNKKTVFIFGGGHVAKETAALANFVDFRTVVLDDRSEFANEERFPYSEVIVVKSYAELPELPIDDQSFIVILTRGHLGDYDVIKRMLGTNAYYVGMIGSRNKRNLIYERLKNEGIGQDQIDRVHAPIGLPINGETPAEIAVSILAEMILERSRLK